MKVLKKNKGFTKSKGFTLVELIVVIAIIGILAGVLIPTITGYIKRADQSAAYQEAAGVLNIYETWENEVEAGLGADKYFADYYKKITEEDLSENYYIEYATTTEKKVGNEVSLIFVDGKIVVKINIENKTVSYLDSSPIPATNEGLYSSSYDLLGNCYYE